MDFFNSLDTEVHFRDHLHNNPRIDDDDYDGAARFLIRHAPVCRISVDDDLPFDDGEDRKYSFLYRQYEKAAKDSLQYMDRCFRFCTGDKHEIRAFSFCNRSALFLQIIIEGKTGERHIRTGCYMPDDSVCQYAKTFIGEKKEVQKTVRKEIQKAIDAVIRDTVFPHIMRENRRGSAWNKKQIHELKQETDRMLKKIHDSEQEEEESVIQNEENQSFYVTVSKNGKISFRSKRPK